MRARLVALAVACASLLVVQSPPASAQARLTVSPDEVLAAGLTPAGTAVWLGATQVIAADEVPEIRAYLRTVTAGKDGMARLEIPGGVPEHSVWVVVDFTTGASGSASPAGFPLRALPWRGQGVVRASGTGDRVEDVRQTGDLLLVRPGVGAWFVGAGDGGPADADGIADGTLRISLGVLKPLEASGGPPPSEVGARDVLVMLDPRTLELTIAAGGAN